MVDNIGKVKFHHPKKLPLSGVKLDFNKFTDELQEAQFSLGLLQGSQKKLQNPALLISPLTAKEAAVSSKIEGTISTVSDVLLYDASGQAKHSDTLQVSNYRQAMNYAITQLASGRELSPHLIKTLHGILLQNVRCKGPLGKFRDDKVWIGEKSTDPIEKAIYIPPEHHLINEYIENLFLYLNNGTDSALIKTGIAHYQFEAIHPFGDGNGRIGRLLIPLILYQKAKLSQPILYISGYLDDNRDTYIAGLHEVDETDQFENWLKFYLKAISSQLKETQILVDRIYQLYDSIKLQFAENKSPYLIPFIDAIFESPFFTIPIIQDKIRASARNTSVSLINAFEERKLISEVALKFGKAKVYIFKPLVNLL